MSLSPSTFTEAMSRFASGVTIVTGRDEQGKAHGYTATAFTSVSLDPPLLLTCLSTSAACYPVFKSASSFCVNVLSEQDQPYALHFAAKMEDKFRAHDFIEGYAGIPCVATALAVIGCDVEAAYPMGDHIILVGRVQHVALQDGEPLIYYTRQFRSISAAAS